ncbi:biosynthetic peptidoglycan transglycosylase-like isoform X6 [Phoenix dactylifera]|uniref:Biosynthetic peptidoglycan transglycosylase-like isoform X6 n=1 Tax=Phoenix dactylifera TaxID=42345 RepID=A0A8B9AKI1_PHODC|nr:biosynthetic peptidoglycan transglycosylase-like isoform X6 [Phoenix dactylifera]
MSLLGPTHPLLVTAAGPRDSRHRLVALRNSPTPFPFLSSTPKPNPLRFPVRCGAPQPPVDSQKPWPSLFRFLNHLPVSLLSAGFLCAHAFLRALPADFPDRWRHLLEFSKGAETKVTQLPYHLIQAVMASEDRRFFYHFGVDPYGIGRAVVYYPNGGGGSTITQQLVKNVFLTNERKISRKFVEGILSLILERRMSKWEILYSYLNKMYWGHGKFGIESASLFYFGKHPSLLNVGESALLVGILPSPETFNPFTNPTRGKSSQARALRRMVAAGFLDLETALVIVSQPLCLHTDGIGEFLSCRNMKISENR